MDTLKKLEKGRALRRFVQMIIDAQRGTRWLSSRAVSEAELHRYRQSLGSSHHADLYAWLSDLKELGIVRDTDMEDTTSGKRYLFNTIALLNRLCELDATPPLPTPQDYEEERGVWAEFDREIFRIQLKHSALDGISYLRVHEKARLLVGDEDLGPAIPPVPKPPEPAP